MPDHISAMIHHIDNVPLTTPCKYICHPLQFHHCNGSGWMIMIYASTADRSCIYIKDKMLFNSHKCFTQQVGACSHDNDCTPYDWCFAGTSNVLWVWLGFHLTRMSLLRHKRTQDERPTWNFDPLSPQTFDIHISDDSALSFTDACLLRHPCCGHLGTPFCNGHD